MISESPEIKIMRLMAWEEAKGKLNGVIKSYRPYTTAEEVEFEEISKEFEDFMTKMDNFESLKNVWRE